jgi:hypothetical protein
VWALSAGGGTRRAGRAWAGTSMADTKRSSSASCTGGAPGDGTAVMSRVQSTKTAPGMCAVR